MATKTETTQPTIAERIAALRAFDEETATARNAQVRTIEVQQLDAVRGVADALAAPGVATLLSTLKGLDGSLSDQRQEQVRAILGVLKNVSDFMASEVRRIADLKAEDDAAAGGTEATA